MVRLLCLILCLSFCSGCVIQFKKLKAPGIDIQDGYIGHKLPPIEKDDDNDSER